MRYRHQLFLLLLLGPTAFGCRKKETTVTFDVEDVLTEFVELDSSFPVRYLPTQRIRSTIAVACSRNETSLDQVQSATLSGAELTLTSTRNDTFDFLRQVTVYVLDGQGNNRFVLASLDQVPAGATKLTLTPTSQAMLGHLQKGEYLLTPVLEMKPGGQVVGNLKLTMRYQVQARKQP